MIAQPLPCAEVVRQIWDWLDNELPDDRWRAIEDHLGTCDGCRSHVTFARDFLDRVKAGADSPPPGTDALRARIRAALRERT